MTGIMREKKEPGDDDKLVIQESENREWRTGIAAYSRR
jgi:hypothetical protein